MFHPNHTTALPTLISTQIFVCFFSSNLSFDPFSFQLTLSFLIWIFHYGQRLFNTIQVCCAKIFGEMLVVNPFFFTHRFRKLSGFLVYWCIGIVMYTRINGCSRRAKNIILEKSLIEFYLNISKTITPPPNMTRLIDLF